MFENIHEASMVPLVVKDELDKAGIPCLKDQKNPAEWLNDKADGQLGDWRFYREDTRWMADAPYIGELKGLHGTIAQEFASRWAGAFRLIGTNATAAGSTVFRVQIMSYGCLAAFAHLIKAFETPKETLTTMPAEAVAKPTKVKPPLYQAVLENIEGVAEAYKRYPPVITKGSVLLRVLNAASFPDQAERAWILAKLEEIKGSGGGSKE